MVDLSLLAGAHGGIRRIRRLYRKFEKRELEPSERALWLGSVLVLAVLVLFPLGNLLYGTFLSESPVRPGGQLTYEQWVRVYGDPKYLGIVANTLMISIPVTFFAITIGGTLAWINSRTDTPGVRLFELGIIGTALLSPLVGVLAWMLVASPNAGWLNVLSQNLFGFSLINILTFPGVLFVMTLDFVPYAYLLTIAALRQANPALEEASRTLGGSLWSTTRRITLPMMTPAILGAALLVFVLASESFAVPGTLGRAAGVINLPYAIYREVNTVPADWPMGATLGTILLGMTLIALLLYQRVIKDTRRFAGVASGGGTPTVSNIGRWRYLTVLANLTFLALAFFIPYATLLVSSFLRYNTPQFTRDLFTLEHYKSLLDARVLDSLRITGIVSIMAATLVVALAVVVVLIAHRSHVPGRRALDTISVLPIAVPGSVFAIALLWSYFRIPWPIYGTPIVLVLAYWAGNLPVAVRGVTGSVMRVDVSLEDASRVLGASRLRAWRTITLPLARTGTFYAWLFILALVVREVNAAVILGSSSEMRMLSVLIWADLDAGYANRAAAIGTLQTVIIFGLGIGIFLMWKLIRKQRRGEPQEPIVVAGQTRLQ